MKLQFVTLVIRGLSQDVQPANLFRNPPSEHSVGCKGPHARLRDVNSNRLTLLPPDLTTESSSAAVNALSWHSDSHTDFFTAVVLHPKKRLSNLDMDHLHVTSDINVISPPLFSSFLSIMTKQVYVSAPVRKNAKLEGNP